MEIKTKERAMEIARTTMVSSNAHPGRSENFEIRGRLAVSEAFYRVSLNIDQAGAKQNLPFNQITDRAGKDASSDESSSSRRRRRSRR